MTESVVLSNEINAQQTTEVIVINETLAETSKSNTDSRTNFSTNCTVQRFSDQRNEQITAFLTK